MPARLEGLNRAAIDLTDSWPPDHPAGSAPCKPMAETVEIKINDWRRTERQRLRDEKTADDGDAQRPPQFRRIVGTEPHRVLDVELCKGAASDTAEHPVVATFWSAQRTSARPD